MIVSERDLTMLANNISPKDLLAPHLSLFSSPYFLFCFQSLITKMNYKRQQAQGMECINSMGTTPQRLAPQPLGQ